MKSQRTNATRVGGGERIDGATPKLSRREWLAASAVLASGLAHKSVPAVGDDPLRSTTAAPAPSLWSAAPAREAEVLREAYPLGNGRLGALAGGDPQRDFFYLTESTMWQGTRNARLDDAGQFAYDTAQFGSTTMLAKLYIDIDGQSDVSSYRRELDLADGLLRVSYRNQGVEHRRTAFASHPAGALVVHIEQDGKPFDGRITLQGAHDEISTGDAATPAVAIRGALNNGLRYAAVVGATSASGSVELDGNALRLRGCHDVTLALCAQTDYAPRFATAFRDPSIDPLHDAAAKLRQVLRRGHAQLLGEHWADHRRLFASMQVDLGTSTPQQRSLETWHRLQARSAPGAAADPELEASYLQFGRYLMIAGSRDSLPMPLQGLWLADNTPPWMGDYHSDINLQMNYWLPDRAGLADCFNALTRYCCDQVASWTALTQRFFNDPRNRFRNRSGRAAGWTVAISTNPFGGNGWWWHPAGSAWLCNSLWQHYEYTQDRRHLERIQPLMKGACEFWQARLVETTVVDATNGRQRRVLIDDADWSPEHGPEDARGITYAQEWVWDLFTNYREACRLSGRDGRHAQQVAALQARLYLPAISPRSGMLEEWMSADELGEPRHRHLSPLVGLFPGDRIAVDRSPPALIEAAAALLRARGSESFGWACAWRSMCWSRLKNAETAYQLVIETMRPSVSNSNGSAPNFFDIYSFGSVSSCFQIDANEGTPVAMIEMLLYSRPGLIELLPALPAAWRERGRVAGIGARGGFVVDFAWRHGALTALRIRSVGGRSTIVKAGAERRRIELARGDSIDVPLPLAEHG